MSIYNYGRQSVDQSDADAVIETLFSDWLTCGPKTAQFEEALRDYTGAKYCVSVANATAGLHLAMLALGIGPGDEGITSPITFLSSANCLCFAGARPVFADIDSRTANISPEEIERRISPDTRVIIPVHFAGQSCEMDKISEIARKRGIHIVEDAAHAIGSEYKGAKVGSCAFSDMTVFSFHPVKTITTGEGGAICTNDEALYKKLCALKAHGVHKDGEMRGDWRYEMRELGFNYRMCDLQAALGLSQLDKLDKFRQRRREIVDWYNNNLELPHLEELEASNACFHLYPVLVEDREGFYHRAKAEGLNLQVHYIPVHLQPFYRRMGYKAGDYPKAEEYYSKCISLPLYPGLTDGDLEEIREKITAII